MKHNTQNIFIAIIYVCGTLLHYGEKTSSHPQALAKSRASCLVVLSALALWPSPASPPELRGQTTSLLARCFSRSRGNLLSLIDIAPYNRSIGVVTYTRLGVSHRSTFSTLAIEWWSRKNQIEGQNVVFKLAVGFGLYAYAFQQWWHWWDSRRVGWYADTGFGGS